MRVLITSYLLSLRVVIVMSMPSPDELAMVPYRAPPSLEGSGRRAQAAAAFMRAAHDAGFEPPAPRGSLSVAFESFLMHLRKSCSDLGRTRAPRAANDNQALPRSRGRGRPAEPKAAPKRRAAATKLNSKFNCMEKMPKDDQIEALQQMDPVICTETQISTLTQEDRGETRLNNPVIADMTSR